MSAITKEGGDGERGGGGGVRFVFGEEEEVWAGGDEEMGRNLQIASHFIVIALVSWLEHPLLRLRQINIATGSYIE